MPDKCVFVLGPESTGSMLAARVCAHVLKIRDFDDWDGVGWCESEIVGHKVLHRSLPYGLNPPEYPDIDLLKKENQHYHQYFVITTRDISLASISKRHRFGKSKQMVAAEMEKAKSIITTVMNSKTNNIIWSYESFMYLELAYLKKLYHFLGVESDFVPLLKDGNKKRLQRFHWIKWLRK